jgi:glycosyltransferase involved in cell wall biosynthesis
MSVSAIVPTRGRAFLAEALKSIEHQTRVADEIVVVADGCCPLIHPVGPRVRLTTLRTSRGAAAARNVGAQVAHHDWLAFLDDDDWWLPRYLETAVEAASKTNADVVCTSFLAADGGVLRPEKDAPIDLADADFISRNPGFRASNLLIRASVFAAVGGFEETLLALHDLDLGLRLARAAIRYARVADRLVVHRKHEGSRISGYGSTELAQAVPAFFARHRHLMSEEQERAFRLRAIRYFGVKMCGEVTL